MVKRFKVLVTLLLFLSPHLIYSQEIAIKNNLVYDVLATPNLGLEIGLGKKTSFDGMFIYAPFGYKENKTYKHVAIQPGLRFWFCERSNGLFWGIHTHWAAFNEGGYKFPFGDHPDMKNNRYEGQLWGGGLSLGYQLPLSIHWGIEGELGLGYAYLDYKKYDCPTCGDLKGKSHKNYVGPTKAAINLIYQF